MVLVEALLVLPLMILLIAGMIEVGTMMLQWNQTVKSLHVGARLLAVSDPLTDISTLEPTGVQGNPVPFSTAEVTCGAGTTPCDAVALNRLLTGSDGACGSSGGSVQGVCDIAPFIGAENLRVSYRNAALGYVGRPYGPVVSVTLEARNVNFRFFTLGAAMQVFGGSIANITIPAHPVSVLSEDLSSCKGACS